MSRAQKGGETGINGEEYKGGQFLPNTTLPKGVKGNSAKATKSRKQEIEPYTWEYPPEGKRSIYSQFAGLFGKIINGDIVVNCSDTTIAYYGKTRKEVEELANRYNNGERWA